MSEFERTTEEIAADATAEIAKLLARCRAANADAMTHRGWLTKVETELSDAKRELDKLRSEREPVSNGDGTVTQLLPVTFAAKWSGRAARVAVPKFGDRYVNLGVEHEAETPASTPGGVRLILSPPEPKPATWRCPLTDGLWIAREDRVNQPGGAGVAYTWGEAAIAGFTRAPQPGRYEFKNGVGTPQGDA